ncbi:hypothetical protein EDB84DRAFT_1558877 [Lactarius hengduanensis]|nr:hypothetical protein EDB84DRAFT_1558877 [Lactarius hengduanensis]
MPQLFHRLLILGRQTADSENLDLDKLLKVGFSLRDGSVHITCPTFTPGKNYIVVLFGDSGNASPQLTISGVDNSEGTVPRAFIYCINEDYFCSLVKYYIYTLALRGFEFNARISIVPIVDVTSDTVITVSCA